MRTQSICVALAVVLLCPFASAQWEQVGLAHRRINDVAVSIPEWFAITGDSGTVFRSTNGGVTWSQIFTSGAKDIAVSPNVNLCLLIAQDTLYRSADGGASWINGNISPLYTHLLSVEISPYGWDFCGINTSAIKVGSHDKVALSTDNGLTWTIPPGVHGGRYFVFSSHSVMTVGDWSGYDAGGSDLSISSDDGRTWREPFGYPIVPLAWCSNGNVLSGDLYGGIVVSTDTLATTKVGPRVIPSVLIALPQGGVLAGTDTAGIYVFTDNGDSLGTVNQGLTDLHIHALALDKSGYVYAGTNAGIWRRPLSQIVSVNDPVTNMPASPVLEQNYPNPFNPTTKIQFTIVNRQLTIVKVYDVLGSEVAMLVNEVKEPGTYTVQFDGSNLASGVYFYRLQAGDFVQTKHLLLLK